MKTETRKVSRRGAAAALVALAALFSVSSPALADKLVVFRNGKAMRVKSATKDGKWLKCEFEDKNYISVPGSTVLAIEEAALGASTGDLRPNQVAAGSGGGYVPGPRGGDAGPPPEAPLSDNQISDDDPSIGVEEEQAYQRQKAMEAQAAAGRRGMTRGIPIAPGQNPGAIQQGLTGIPGGFQPLNQATTPFQNRRLNTRRGVPGDRLRQGSPGQSNQDE